MGALPTAIDEDRLGESFAALANSTRRAILTRLANGAATLSEPAEPFELTLPAISKHIKVLGRAGLVQRGQQPSTDRVRSTAGDYERSSRGPRNTGRCGRPDSTVRTWHDVLPPDLNSYHP